MTPDVITLPDDIRLSWHEFGDPDGAPVLYTAGSRVQPPTAPVVASGDHEDRMAADGHRARAKGLARS